MKTMNMIERWTRAWMLAGLGLLGSAQALAHGGLSIDQDLCKLRVGPYIMHFAGYQPGLAGAKEFCEDIPGTGPTTVVMDAVDGVLREMPIEVRIVVDTGDGRDRDTPPVVHLPPRLYPAGSVSFENTFDKPGKFVGYVIAGSQGEHVARFPFSVGAERPAWGTWLAVAGFVAGAVMLYLFTVRSGRRRAAAHGAADRP